MSVAYQHVHSDVPRPGRPRAGHPGGARRPDRRGHPAGPGAATAGRLRVPGGAGRDPLATGLAPGAGARSRTAPTRAAAPAASRCTPAPVAGPQVGRRRHPDAGRRRRSGLGAPTAPQPTQAAGPPARRRPASPTVALAPAHAPPLADRDPGGAAARAGRGRRRLVAGRPLGGHPGRRRPVPGAGRNPGPGRRPGAPGHRRAPQRRRRRPGRPVTTRPPAPNSCAARGRAAGLQRPAGGARRSLPAPTGRRPPPR